MEKKQNTGKPVKIGWINSRWNTRVFESSGMSGVISLPDRKKIAQPKRKRYLVIPQPETKHPTRIRDFAFIEAYTPTPETLAQNLTHNKNLELSEILTPDQEKRLSANLEESLKFPYPVDFKIRTYEKSLIIAKRSSEIIHRGKLIRRTIKEEEKTPPDYETFKVAEGYTYRFYFRDNEAHKTVIRDIKTNRARVHPTRKIYYPKPDGSYKALKILLPLNKIVQLTPVKSVIYEIKLKERYKIKTAETIKRSHAKAEISIDYKRLSKAEKRISKKWFALLVKSLKDETLINSLTPHLKKLRRKIIVSKAVTPDPLKKQRPITPRVSTVTARTYKHKLRIETETITEEMKARKLGLRKRKITVTPTTK